MEMFVFFFVHDIWFFAFPVTRSLNSMSTIINLQCSSLFLVCTFSSFCYVFHYFLLCTLLLYKLPYFFNFKCIKLINNLTLSIINHIFNIVLTKTKFIDIGSLFLKPHALFIFFFAALWVFRLIRTSNHQQNYDSIMVFRPVHLNHTFDLFIFDTLTYHERRKLGHRYFLIFYLI
jgi:hypothetical protein